MSSDLRIYKQTESISARPEKETRVRLVHIDSLRALAALYVLIFHAFGQLEPYETDLAATHPLVEKFVSFCIIAIFRYGQFAVAVFIVISGYCLMLPLAFKQMMSMESVPHFIFRRAKRILPPYYAALIISLLLMWLVPGMMSPTGGFWTSAVPVFTRSIIFSHVALIHHWRDAWILKIDPPLWSIGVEWQIYFLMPLVFLPILRNWGKWALVIVTGIAGAALAIGLFNVLPQKEQYVHFIALFATGMVASQICFSAAPADSKVRNAHPWATYFLISLTFISILLALQTRKTWQEIPWIKIIGRFTWANVWTMDYLVAGCFSCLLVALVQDKASWLQSSIGAFLNWKPLVLVGHFSYSIYLIHDPVLRVACLTGQALHLVGAQQYLFVSTLGIGFAVFCGYLLYLLVERHFISSIPVHSR